MPSSTTMGLGLSEEEKLRRQLTMLQLQEEHICTPDYNLKFDELREKLENNKYKECNVGPI